MKSEEDREFDEKSLIKQVASGDHKAFTILYMRYLHGLYRYIYLFTKSKETTEEIIQNVFVKIWERRDLLAGVNTFKPYLYRSAKNMLIDEIRRNQVEAKVLFLVKPDTEQSNETSDAQIIYTQYYQIAQNAIAVDAFRDNAAPTDAQVNTFLAPLRNPSTLPNSLITTYTYDPLVGMTSMTDAKGEITMYEYDNFQRLMNIKDKDGNIVKHMEYHYQNQ